jgi:hypothetical protein
VRALALECCALYRSEIPLATRTELDVSKDISTALNSIELE